MTFTGFTEGDWLSKFKNLPAFVCGTSVTLTDDMAVLPDIGAQPLLCAVDTVIEGKHFLVEHPIEWVVRKALSRNLSDVAAMGAKPVACLWQCAFRNDITTVKAESCRKALWQWAAEFDCPIIGGDTSVMPSGQGTQMSITILAQAQSPVTREGAKAGDKIYVSGQLGGSLYQEGNGMPHHIGFIPRVKLSQTLLEKGCRPTAMMDISDGLLKDLPRLVSHAIIDTDAIPVSVAAVNLAKTSGKTPLWHACVDGEDYELLCVFPAHAAIPSKVVGVSMTCIGTVTESLGIQWLNTNEIDIGPQLFSKQDGWQHQSR